MKPLAATLCLILLSAHCGAETTLTLVSSWNRQQNFTTLFMEYVDAVNAAGKGVVQIDFRGGPDPAVTGPGSCPRLTTKQAKPGRWRAWALPGYARCRS